jgi:hypothetical protein
LQDALGPDDLPCRAGENDSSHLAMGQLLEMKKYSLAQKIIVYYHMAIHEMIKTLGEGIQSSYQQKGKGFFFAYIGTIIDT